MGRTGCVISMYVCLYTPWKAVGSPHINADDATTPIHHLPWLVDLPWTPSLPPPLSRTQRLQSSRACPPALLHCCAVYKPALLLSLAATTLCQHAPLPYPIRHACPPPSPPTHNPPPPHPPHDDRPAFLVVLVNAHRQHIITRFDACAGGRGGGGGKAQGYSKGIHKQRGCYTSPADTGSGSPAMCLRFTRFTTNPTGCPCTLHTGVGFKDKLWGQTPFSVACC